MAVAQAGEEPLAKWTLSLRSPTSEDETLRASLPEFAAALDHRR